jgi:hypothetical protein
MVRRSVVLPQPDGPSNEKNARLDRQRQPVDDAPLAIGDGQILDRNAHLVVPSKLEAPAIDAVSERIFQSA